MSKLVKSKFEIAFNIRQEASPPKIETDFTTRTGALIILPNIPFTGDEALPLEALRYSVNLFIYLLLYTCH